MFAYVGCFSPGPRKGKGEGIQAYRMDPVSGAWTPIQYIGGLFNPSWLETNRAETVLYVAHGDRTYLSTYAIDRQTGLLASLGQVESGGSNTVRVVLDPAERFLLAANLTGGSVSVHPVSTDGRPEAPIQVFPMPGEPRDHRRIVQQDHTRPHDIVFDPTGRFFIVPDKGLDCVFVFRYDAKKGRIDLVEDGVVEARAGSAPRHALFHPRLPIVWVINEMDSTLTTYRWDGRRGRLTPVDVVSTLPPDFHGDTSGSEIAFDPVSSTLYAANRGHDSIALYRVNRRTGLAKPFAWEPTRGGDPRHFLFHAKTRLLYASNETGHSVIPFRVDARTGRLRALSRKAETPSPVTVVVTG
jgi:6-phosphogluconolactonase (cycloisomerase 2 family)